MAGGANGRTATGKPSRLTGAQLGRDIPGEAFLVPVVELFRKHWLLVILAALVFVGNNAAGYMATGRFIPSWCSRRRRTYTVGYIAMALTAHQAEQDLGSAIFDTRLPSAVAPAQA
ncbi:hypothetical protein [Arthrobacter dokdonensis]|uniref:hypothetical protein n=1 Tax=Arthrobacter dokdonellae TaxID=2211210 RepID=UPI001013C594|nr:hypothetical protein [Arthrobacter dokdonellae]